MTPEEWALVVDALGASEALALAAAADPCPGGFYPPHCAPVWCGVLEGMCQYEAVLLDRAKDAAKRLYSSNAPWDSEGCYFDRSTL